MLLPIPWWGEISVWIYVGGLVTNLPFMVVYHYRLHCWTQGCCFPQHLQHLGLDHRWAALASALWFPLWAIQIVKELWKRDGDTYHGFAIVFGSRKSYNWAVEHDYI